MSGTVPAQGFVTVLELPPQTVTAAGNSGALLVNEGLSFGSVLLVEQVSGTLPTLNVVLQVSLDGGLTWQDVWHFEQLTAPGSAIMPPLPVFGQHRFLWTVGGTTPSFTFQITSTASAQAAKSVRRFFDYTAALLAGTVGPGATFDVTGAAVITGTLTLGATTTPGSYALQLSTDGVNWYQPGAAVAAVANGTIDFTVSNVAARFVRLACTSAGTTQVGVVGSITAL